ncbi:MAG: carboxypeptidase-like regulatory domain-containing protein [Bacteroidales bacterium]|nr:carboxypeptidase-like regulatory domain-containing protein [Bacteroidales bacterium]
MFRFTRLFFSLALVLLLPLALPAQISKVRGRVFDAQRGEPVPYASVFFEGTSIGVSTDGEGRYYIETHDTTAVWLTVQILGYNTRSVKVVPGVFSEIDFALEEDVDVLSAARIKPDDRWIRHILAQIDAQRERHDPESGDPWSVRVYSKVELDATHAEWLASRSALRRVLGGMTEYRDTSAVTGEPYLPFMLSETLSQKYHSVDPAMDREEIVANRISGLDADNFLRQYAGSYLLKTNFYKSTITLFNLDVPSPAAAYGHFFYNYYLVDSLEMDGRKTYCLRFHPKKGITSPTFDGEFYVDAADFGIRSSHVALAKGANVNWIRHNNIDTENRKTADGRWFPKEEKLFIDFSIAVRDSSKVISFLGNRELHYDTPGPCVLPAAVLESPDDVVVSNVAEMDEASWAAGRPVPLSPREQGIYKVVEEVQQRPAYKVWYTVGRSLIVGYIEGEKTKVAFGPWAQVVKYNTTEGWHVGAGFRTTKFFHPAVRLTADVGYGFRDHKVKGGVSAEYMIRRDVTRKLTVSGDYGYRQLGQGSASITQPGMFSSLFAFHGGDKQTLIRHLGIDYEHEFSPVFTSFFDVSSTRLFGNAMVPLLTQDGAAVRSVSLNQFNYTARFAWKERIDRGHFKKAHIYTRYPVLGFKLSGGLSGITPDDFSFLRGEFSFDWKVPAGAFGFASAHLDAGAIFGEMPYPFLKLHEGNPTFFLDRSAFSCMALYEFASDLWLSTMYEHNLNGLILGRIPLIRLLDLREIITLKAAVGTLSSTNRNGRIRPIDGLSTLEKPYIEAGVGLSNLLRVIRVDATWRLTHRREDSRNFRFTVGFDVQF